MNLPLNLNISSPWIYQSENVEEEKLTHPVGNIYFGKSIQSFRLKTFLLVLGAGNSEEKDNFIQPKNYQLLLFKKRQNGWIKFFGGNSFGEGQSESQAAVVHLNFQAGSTFPVPVCTVSPGHWVNKADTQ